MNNFNFTIIEGLLTTIPERKDNVVTFTIGSKRQKVVDGVTMTNETNMKIVVTDRLADVCEKYLSVGSKVLVSGQLCGEDSSFFVKGSEVNFLSPKG